MQIRVEINRLPASNDPNLADNEILLHVTTEDGPQVYQMAFIDDRAVYWARTTLAREGSTLAGVEYTLESCLKGSPVWWATWKEGGPLIKCFREGGVMTWLHVTPDEMRQFLVRIAFPSHMWRNRRCLRVDLGYLDCYYGWEGLQNTNSHPEVPMNSIRTATTDYLPTAVDSLVLEGPLLPSTTTVHRYLGFSVGAGPRAQLTQMTAGIPIVNMMFGCQPRGVPRLSDDQCLELRLGDVCTCHGLLGRVRGRGHRCRELETQLQAAIQMLEHCRPGMGLLTDPERGMAYAVIRDGSTYRRLEDEDVPGLPFYYLYEPAYQSSSEYREIVARHLSLRQGGQVYVIQPSGERSTCDYGPWRYLGSRDGLCRLLVREHSKRARPADLVGGGQAPPLAVAPLWSGPSAFRSLRCA